jgi:tetratricopeptide (TPR) repeat protein
MPTIQLALATSGDSRKEKIQEAFGYLNQATSNSPNNINIWQLRLSAVFELAKTENQYLDPAIRSAEIIASLAPTEAKFQYNLATLYNLKKDYKKAQEQLEKVVELKPDYKEAWQLLLEVDTNLKDKQGLEKHQEKYKKLFRLK